MVSFTYLPSVWIFTPSKINPLKKQKTKTSTQYWYGTHLKHKIQLHAFRVQDLFDHSSLQNSLQLNSSALVLIVHIYSSSSI